MLIKTEHFVRTFLTDLSQILFFSKDYRRVLDTYLNQGVDLNKLLSDRRAFPKMRFIGSFATKKYGQIVSDIDFIQYVKMNPGLMSRLVQIVTNDRSNFTFIRLYSGEDEGIQLPWELTPDGSCSFSLDKIGAWLDKLRPVIPPEVYNQVTDILNQDTLSIRDLVNIESIVKTYISIVWSAEDIDRGYQERRGKRYDLLELLQNPTSKTVLKFIYKYYDPVHKKNEYCLVDCSLNNVSGSMLSLQAYYSENEKQKFKGIKFYLPHNIKEDYLESIRQNVGYLTSLAARLELLVKIEKYNRARVHKKIISQEDFDRMVSDVAAFAQQNGYYFDRDRPLAAIEQDVAEIIAQRMGKLYHVYRDKVKEEANKPLDFFEVRGMEAQFKVNKALIRKRSEEGVACPLFYLSVDNVYFLNALSRSAKIPPTKLAECIHIASNKHGVDPSTLTRTLSDKNLHLEEHVSNYSIMDGADMLIDDVNLKTAQIMILFWTKLHL